jgi:hypothetical protein
MAAEDKPGYKPPSWQCERVGLGSAAIWIDVWDHEIEPELF